MRNETVAMILLRRSQIWFALSLLCFSVAACGADESGGTIVVPTDEQTIQAAVDRARTGDIVLIEPGVYNESVTITTDGIVIRGQDRNKVVLDGQDRLPNGIYVAADNVRVENLTARAYTQNGVVFNGIDEASGGYGVDPDVAYGTDGRALDGYEVRWVTTYNNGLYGIYAFASVNGLIEDSYASGHPDSGIYVGQCKPCNVVVRRVTAETNAIGYYGTNASGNVFVIESTFAGNRLGVAPNSQEMEKLAPQSETVVAGNLVTDNDNPRAPAIKEGFFGGGIIIGGGTRNTVVRNRVEGHSNMGIGIIDFNSFVPIDNRIEGNSVTMNSRDLVYAVRGSTSAEGNCFSRNVHETSVPEMIERLLPCDGQPTALTPYVLSSPTPPPDVDYRKISAPPAQQSMPATAMSRPAGTAAFTAPDVSGIALP